MTIFLINRKSLANYYRTLNDLLQEELVRNEKIQTIIFSSLRNIYILAYTYFIMSIILYLQYFLPPYLFMIRDLCYSYLFMIVPFPFNYELPLLTTSYHSVKDTHTSGRFPTTSYIIFICSSKRSQYYSTLSSYSASTLPLAFMFIILP